MLNDNKQCPVESRLSLFASGELGEDDADALRVHLEQCATCREVVSNVPHFPKDIQQTIDSSSAASAKPDNDDTEPTLPRATLPLKADAGQSEIDASDIGPNLSTAGVLGGLQSEPAPQAPPVIPGFEIVSVLGQGGMGIVYEAEQVGLNRSVALKMILPGALADPEVLGRFRVEAETVARLKHPNIVSIHEVGESQGMPFFALEFVEGGSLDQSLKSTSVTARTAAQLVSRLASAIEYAHQRGVVHRDLKPANILLGEVDSEADGSSSGSSGSRKSNLKSKRDAVDTADSVDSLNFTPKITDFGLARLTDVDQRQTRTGAVMGTPSYMAPEQAAGMTYDVGPSADIYSLGVILYELLTGRIPFRAENIVQTLQLVQNSPPVPPSKLQPGLHRDLETICLKCLQKEPEKRYETAGDLHADLNHFINGEPIVARPVSSIERTYRWAKRKPVIAGLLGVVALLAIAMIIVPTIFALRLQVANSLANAATVVANDEKREAQRQEAIAKEKEAAAKAAEARAEAARKIADQRYVASVINLAGNAFDNNETPRTVNLLETVRPRFDEPDYRSFDWYRLWHQCFKHREFVYEASRYSIRELVCSADGKEIISLAEDWKQKSWRTESGKFISETQHDEFEPPLAIALSDDDQYMITALKTGDVVVHEQHEGEWKEAHRLRVPAGFASALAFVPGSHQFVAATTSGSLVADADSGQEIQRFGFAQMASTAVAVARDGTFIIAEQGGIVTMRRKQEGKWLPREFIGDGSSGVTAAVAFCKDDSRFVLATPSDIRVYNTTPLKKTHHLKIPASNINAIEFGFSKDIVYAGCNDGSLRRFDLATDSVRVVTHASAVKAIAVNQADGTVFAGTADGDIAKWRIEDKAEEDVLQATRYVNDAELSPDGRLLVVARRFSNIELFDLESRTRIGELECRLGAFPQVTFSNDGKKLAAGMNSGEVHIWNVEDWQLDKKIEGNGNSVMAVAFSPDGKQIASLQGSYAGVICEVETGEVLQKLPGGTSGRSIEFSPDGKWLAIAAEWYPMIFDLTKNQHAYNLPAAAGGSIVGMRFSPNGEVLAVGNNNGTITLWDTDTWSPVAELRGHAGEVKDLRFDRSGEFLLSLGTDRTLRYWQISIGQERCSWRLNQLGVAICFSGDSETDAILAYESGRIEFLPVANDDVARRSKDELYVKDPTSPRGLNELAKRNISTGRLEIARQNYADAADRLRLLIEHFPDDHRYKGHLALSLIGLAQLSEDNPEPNLQEAVELSGVAMKADHNNDYWTQVSLDSNTNLARYYHSTGKPEEARAVLKNFLLSLKGKPGVIARSVIMFASAENSRQEDVDLALEFARKAVGINPDGKSERLALAIALYRSGVYEESLENFYRCGTIYSLGPLRWPFMSMIHSKLEKPEAARMWLRRAMYGREAYNGDDVIVSDEDLDRIHEEAQSLVNEDWEAEIDPIDEAKWWYKAGMELRKQSPTWSLDLFQRSFDLNAESAENILAGAEVSYESKSLGTAVAWANAAVHYFPEDKRFLQLRARYFEESAYLRPAGRAYLRLAELEPDGTELYLKSASLFLSAYDITHARDAVDAALKISPENADTLIMHLEVCSAEGTLENEIPTFLKLQQLDKLPKGYWKNSEAAFGQKGNYFLYNDGDDETRANAKPYYIARIEILKNILADEPGRAEDSHSQIAWTHHHLAVVARAAGSKEDSQRHLSQSVDSLMEALKGTDATAEPNLGLMNLLTLTDAPQQHAGFLDVTKKLVEVYPNSGSTHNALGISHYFQNNYRESIAAFRKAEELSYMQLDYSIFAMSYVRLKDRSNATASLERGAKAWEELAQWRNANPWPAGVMARRRELAERQLNELKSRQDSAKEKQSVEKAEQK